MATVKVSEWISDVTPILLNPSASQRLSLMRLRDVKDGLIDVPDATSPFAWTLENSSVNTAGFLEANELSTRRQYASVAQTTDDLYLHMSDKDFIDRFATPARGTFYIMIEKRALDRALVFDVATGISKVTIPRNTEFQIEDINFAIQYPIEIKKVTHGGYQVTYDTDKESPLEVLTTNKVEHEFIEPRSGTVFLKIKVPVQQFWIKSMESTLTTAKMFSRKIPYDDSFYYARVFVMNNNTNDTWREIKTTHTDQVYDPTIATATLQVEPGELKVSIPQIYFTNQLVSGRIRVDIYQTKGNISLNLANYSADNFSATWRAIDSSEVTPEVANFRNISEIIVFSGDSINGGTNQLPFEELRRRVINNTAGARDLPITNVQIEDSLKSNGFNIVKNVDVVTNRTFLATRELIAPFDERLITSAATGMQSLILTMKDLARHPAVFDNGDRITLTPDLVYKIDNGQMQVVSASVVNNINSLPAEEASKLINASQFVYSPFHYVLDATDNQFRVRPYYLDSPKTEIRQFVGHNDTTLFEANTEQYTLSKTTFGYRLTVQVSGNESFNALQDDRMFAQLYYVPNGEVSGAYINGQLVTRTDTGGAVFIFDFITQFDINDNHLIHFTSFTMSNMIDQAVPSSLLNNFNIIYGSFDKINVNWVINDIDSHVGQFMLDDYGYAITEESFRLEFGQWLDNLWAGCRSFPAPNQLVRHEVDIPATYVEDIYKVDPVTGTIFHLDSNNNVEYITEHKKGDIIYDENNQIVYAHRVGDIVYGSNGLPTPISETEIARQVDLLVVEGAYYFATDPSSSTYKINFVAAMVDWIIDDLARLKTQTLEETFIYYYPVSNMGTLKVIGENGTAAYLQASQSFKVRLFVKEQVMKNSDLRNSITESTIRTIDSELKNSIISISTIEKKLGDIYGADVLGIELTGLGGPANYQTISTIGTGDRFSIKKRSTALTDGKLIVEEDVTVEFIQHESLQ